MHVLGGAEAEGSVLDAVLGLAGCADTQSRMDALHCLVGLTRVAAFSSLLVSHPLFPAAVLEVRVQIIIRHARTHSVGKYQSCMF